MSELSLDDVLSIEYPGPPAWSADGGFLASAVYVDDGEVLLVAGIDLDGGVRIGDPWRFEPDDGSVTGFEWAPDGPRLVVTTDADELLVLDAPSRSAERIAAVPGGDANATWAPDGDRIAFYRDGKPWTRDLDGPERAFDVPKRGPYLDDERMLEWGPDGERLAFRFVEDRIKHVGVVDAGSGDLVWRTTGRLASASPAWLADGRVVVDRRGDRGCLRTIEVVDPATGTATELASEEDAELGALSRGAPTVSPDGTRLAVALPTDGWEHVYVLDPDAGTDGATQRQLTAGAFEDKGLADSSPRWLDDGTLVFASNRRNPGERQLFAVDLADGAVTPLVESGGTSVHPRPSPDGRALAYVHAGRSRSPEVRVRPLDGDTDADGRATASAVEGWPAEPIAPEGVTFESADGTGIHGYLIDPREAAAVPDDAAGLPGVVWVHGGPMRQMRDGWHPSRGYGIPYAFHQYLASRGYAGLLVNYRGGIGYGRAFRGALAEGRGDREIEDVVAAGEYLRGLDYVDADAVAVWGLSYGGYATLQVLGTHPEAFDLGINLAGVADLECYRDWAEETKYSPVESFQTVQLDGYPWEAPEVWAGASPETHMDRYEAPLYSFHGTGDRYVNAGQLDVVVDRLLDLDATFEAEYYPGETHVFSRRATWERTLRKVEAALERHLGAPG